MVLKTYCELVFDAQAPVYGLLTVMGCSKARQLPALNAFAKVRSFFEANESTGSV
jgi:hypothetical protein